MYAMYTWVSRKIFNFVVLAILLIVQVSEAGLIP